MLLIQSCQDDNTSLHANQNGFISTIQQNDEFIQKIETALAMEEYPKALDITQAWKQELPHIIKTAKAIQLPHEYAPLQQSLIQKLENYKPIIAKSYPTLIRLRLKSQRNLDEENKLMGNIQRAYAEMSDTFMEMTLLMEKNLVKKEKN